MVKIGDRIDLYDTGMYEVVLFKIGYLASGWKRNHEFPKQDIRPLEWWW